MTTQMTSQSRRSNGLIPENPVVAGATTSLPKGPIGVAIYGIPFFSPYTSDGLDAVETEVFDDRDGHPTQTGVYHYHKMLRVVSLM